MEKKQNMLEMEMKLLNIKSMKIIDHLLLLINVMIKK